TNSCYSFSLHGFLYNLQLHSFPTRRSSDLNVLVRVNLFRRGVDAGRSREDLAAKKAVNARGENPPVVNHNSDRYGREKRDPYDDVWMKDAATPATPDARFRLAVFDHARYGARPLSARYRRDAIFRWMTNGHKKSGVWRLESGVKSKKKVFF